MKYWLNMHIKLENSEYSKKKEKSIWKEVSDPNIVFILNPQNPPTVEKVLDTEDNHLGMFCWRCAQCSVTS